MRIAMISTPFVAVPPREYGGTELVIYELAEGLTARGHEVTLFATGDSRTSATLRWRSPRAAWPPDPLPDLDHAAWALHEAAAAGCDLAHVHSPVAPALHRLVPQLPMVCTLHHSQSAPCSAIYRGAPDIQYVAISADQRARETPLPHITVIHHGLDPARYEWRPRAQHYVAFLGRFAPEKGPHTAIDVAGRAGVPLRIAGEVHPPDRAFAERELTERLTRPHVRALGPVGPAAKAELLRDARALLAPIAWDEPFGLNLIEAMLSGCPVVAFARGSVPELVEPGVTGFVAASADEMVRILRPGGPLEGFDRGRCRAAAVARFGCARMVAEYERLYQAVLRETSGPSRPALQAI